MDGLEVEDNLRMSKIFSDQDNGDKMENKLDLVQKHKQRENFYVHLKPSLSKHKNDHPSDIKRDESANLFSKRCNHPIENFVSGDFKRDFRMHIYDEYEDECMDVVLSKPTMELRSIGKEKLTVIHSQKAEEIEDNEHAKGDSLPLCYSSFELIIQRHKTSKKNRILRIWKIS